MSKNFKFKLDGLLKIREFKEKKVKLELGSILTEIESVKSRIQKDQTEIEECYNAQEEFLSSPSSGQMAQFFPQFIQTKREDQKAQGNILRSLERQYEDKLGELAKAKGEVKVIDKLKDKDETAFNKKKAKKFQETLDEYTMIKKYREKQL